jgi:hypothetical protein
MHTQFTNSVTAILNSFMQITGSLLCSEFVQVIINKENE